MSFTSVTLKGDLFAEDLLLLASDLRLNLKLKGEDFLLITGLGLFCTIALLSNAG